MPASPMTSMNSGSMPLRALPSSMSISPRNLAELEVDIAAGLAELEVDVTAALAELQVDIVAVLAELIVYIAADLAELEVDNAADLTESCVGEPQRKPLVQQDDEIQGETPFDVICDRAQRYAVKYWCAIRTAA